MMKKAMPTIVFTLLLLCSFQLLDAKARINVNDMVYVRSTVEFLEAIAPNTTIFIDMEEYDAIIPTGHEAVEMGEYISWGQAYDGLQLQINGVENLTILGREDTYSHLLSPYSYADVLHFVDCNNLTLQWLNIGHEVEGYCTGGVLAFENCHGVTIENCDLWGCGIEGLSIWDSSGFDVSYTTIRDCSYSIMSIYDSRDIRFQYCLLHDNREFDMMSFKNTPKVRFENCVIWNNRTSGGMYGGKLVAAVYSDVTFNKCTIFNNIVAPVEEDDSIRLLNCTVFNNQQKDWEY